MGFELALVCLRGPDRVLALGFGCTTRHAARGHPLLPPVHFLPREGVTVAGTLPGAFPRVRGRPVAGGGGEVGGAAPLAHARPLIGTVVPTVARPVVPTVVRRELGARLG